MSAEAAPRSARWVGGGLGFLLRAWRKRRRLAQSELADRVGISAKHLSFLETGRARPSREMVDWLAQALRLTDDEKVRLAEAAGFTGEYVAAPLVLDAAIDRDVRATLDALAEPALVHDRFGTIHAFNPAFAEVVAPYADLASMAGKSTGHALLAAVAPHIANWPTLAYFFRQRVEAEILRGSSVDPDLVRLLDALAESCDGPPSRPAGPRPFWIPIELRLTGGGRRAFRLATMTFGAPHDVAWRDVRLALLLEAPSG